MGYGMPVIVSEDTNMLWAVSRHGAGMSFESIEKGGWAHVLSSLEDERDMALFSERAYSYAKKYADWDDIGRRMVDLYKDVV